MHSSSTRRSNVDVVHGLYASVEWNRTCDKSCESVTKSCHFLAARYRNCFRSTVVPREAAGRARSHPWAAPSGGTQGQRRGRGGSPIERRNSPVAPRPGFSRAAAVEAPRRFRGSMTEHHRAGPHRWARLAQDRRCHAQRVRGDPDEPLRPRVPARGGRPRRRGIRCNHGGHAVHVYRHRRRQDGRRPQPRSLYCALQSSYRWGRSCSRAVPSRGPRWQRRLARTVADHAPAVAREAGGPPSALERGGSPAAAEAGRSAQAVEDGGPLHRVSFACPIVEWKAPRNGLDLSCAASASSGSAGGEEPGG
jgi:hypothetical protein